VARRQGTGRALATVRGKKKVAILSAGPSLTRTYRGRDGYEEVIGVNRAVACFECDWWSAFDSCTLDLVKPIGNPRLFTREVVVQSHDTPDDVVIIERVYDEVGIGIKKNTFSLTGALFLAEWLGATEIDIYGHDMLPGAGYCNGDPGNKVDVHRFERERVRYEKIVKEMTAKVRRIQ